MIPVPAWTRQASYVCQGFCPEGQLRCGTKSSFSVAYMATPMPTCRKLLMHWVRKAFAFALDNAGNNIAARMAMMAITTNSSIRVKARCEDLERGVRRELMMERLVAMMGARMA